MNAITAAPVEPIKPERFAPVLDAPVDALVLLYKRPDAYGAFMEALNAAIAPAVDADVNTTEGQDLMRSTAAKVASLKVRVVDTGKQITEDWRRETTRVNGFRNELEAKLQEVQDGVRAPLTAYQNAERARVELVTSVIDRLHQRAIIHLEATAAEITERAQKIRDNVNIDPLVFKDRTEEAKVLLRTTLEKLDAAAVQIAAREAQAARLAELEAAETARIAKEAEEQAARQAETDRLEREKREAQIALDAAEAARIEADREAQARIDRQQAAHAAELQRVADQAEAARVAEAARIEADRLAEAARIEAKRVADEAAAESKRQADAQRQNDIKHRANIRDEIVTSIRDITSATGQFNIEALVDAMVNGDVPHVVVNF